MVSRTLDFRDPRNKAQWGKGLGLPRGRSLSWEVMSILWPAEEMGKPWGGSTIQDMVFSYKNRGQSGSRYFIYNI